MNEETQTAMKCLVLACSPRKGGNTALLARRGMFISCAGTTAPGVFNGTIRTARYFFKMLDVDLAETLCYEGVDQKGEINNHQRALDEVYRQGKALARLIS